MATRKPVKPAKTPKAKKGTTTSKGTKIDSAGAYC